MTRKRILNPAEVDIVIDKWHDGEIQTDTIYEALNWTPEEYSKWLSYGILPVGPYPEP